MGGTNYLTIYIQLLMRNYPSCDFAFLVRASRTSSAWPSSLSKRLTPFLFGDQSLLDGLHLGFHYPSQRPPVRRCKVPHCFKAFSPYPLDHKREMSQMLVPYFLAIPRNHQRSPTSGWRTLFPALSVLRLSDLGRIVRPLQKSLVMPHSL